jgi:hypothetical protein
MLENPYVYSGPPGQTVGQTSKAQYWQNAHAPVGYTAQKLYNDRQAYEQNRQKAYANAMAEMKGGKKRRNKKSKRIKAKSHKNRKSCARRRRM